MERARTLLPRTPARTGSSRGKRYKDDFDFKTVIKFPTRDKTVVVKSKVQFKHFSIQNYGKYQSKAHTMGIIYHAQKPIIMSHQHHQRMSLRVANNNTSVPVDNTNNTNTTNTENNEENTNQMTCVTTSFFFLNLSSFGTPFLAFILHLKISFARA